MKLLALATSNSPKKCGTLIYGDPELLLNMYQSMGDLCMTTKTEFVNQMATELDCSKAEAQRATDSFIKCIENAVQKGDKVTFPGFGTFEVKERSERQGRNPQTGEDMTIKASRNPSFKAGKVLKELANS